MSDSDEELLIEYIDDELPPEKRQQLDERLQKEPPLRKQLETLEHTWNILDLLEPAVSPPQMTARTMNLIAGIAGNEKKRRLFLTPAMSAVVLSVLLAASFYCGTYLASRDDPFFYRAVQRLDMYLAVIDEDADFLQRLTERRLFLPETGTPDTVSRSASFDASAPLLDSQLKRFYALPSRRREQIRELHTAVELAADRSGLVLTLQNYYLWLKSLQSYEKTDLRKRMTAADKIPKIAALKERLDDMPVISQLLQFGQETELADALSALSLQEQEELLNKPPEQILNYLQQSVQKND
ncbi:MAG: hypothetical protein LBT89_02355 [Planctomycetaceae bacterium]|jgi:hypothetical protein|nr:hypothetical protein [Planctomycetaceae bacterium]